MTSDERVDAPPDDHLGFQLSSAETPIYLEPDVTSRILGTLPEGAVVTLLERTPGFLRVLTLDDQFGYIADSTPMTRVEGRVVEGWNVQIPDLPRSPVLEAAGVPDPAVVGLPRAAPGPDTRPSRTLPSNATDVERSRSREGRTFLSRMAEDAEGRTWTAGSSAIWTGLVSAGVGLTGLLIAHALSGLTNAELAAFFAVDVLLPLFVLTGRPNAPISLLGAWVTLYLAAVAGYVAVP